MARSKLPHAKDWQARDVKDWNVTTFHAYLIEKHEEKFAAPYFPFATWVVEKKMLKTCIDEYGRETIKQFIDECFRDYKPNADYAGISFGFMFKYMNRILQRLLSEQAKKQKDEIRRQAEADIFGDDDDELDWI